MFFQALLHACIACSLKPTIDWIAASDLEDESAKLVCSAPRCSFSSHLRLSQMLNYLHCLIYLWRRIWRHIRFFVQTPEEHASAWQTLKVSFASYYFELLSGPLLSLHLMSRTYINRVCGFYSPVFFSFSFFFHFGLFLWSSCVFLWSSCEVLILLWSHALHNCWLGCHSWKILGDFCRKSSA